MSDDPSIDHIAEKLDDGRTLYAHESRALLELGRQLNGALKGIVDCYTHDAGRLKWLASQPLESTDE